MSWVQWDDDKAVLLSIVRHIPDALQGRDAATLAQLGYRELVVQNPEDFIPRFPSLLGSSVFTKMADGRVRQTFPHADFSVSAVRAELVRQLKTAAEQELWRTDWVVVRKMETGKEIPAEIGAMRQKIRDHVGWVVDDLGKTDARSLVEYRWTFPVNVDAQMFDGTPVILMPTEPTPVVDTTPGPQDVATGDGFDPDADGVFGNTDPNVVTPAPPEPPQPVRSKPPASTDGPVPVFDSESADAVFPHLDANGMPLITAYAPTLEDTGPRPDQN